MRPNTPSCAQQRGQRAKHHCVSTDILTWVTNEDVAVSVCWIGCSSRLRFCYCVVDLDETGFNRIFLVLCTVRVDCEQQEVWNKWNDLSQRWLDSIGLNGSLYCKMIHIYWNQHVILDIYSFGSALIKCLKVVCFKRWKKTSTEVRLSPIIKKLDANPRASFVH